MSENECCICLNNIEDENIFRLECCKQSVHHDCIVNWINANIERELPDYNKCILCKSYNKSIDDYYNDLLITQRTNTYVNLDNSNNHLIIVVNSDGTRNSRNINTNIQYFRVKVLVTSYFIVGICIFFYIYFIFKNK